jgi:protein required for attachment to host cells
MKRACIAIVDAAHARLFSYQPSDDATESTIREERDFVNAGRQAHGKFSDTKPGNRWQEGGRGSTDDHRLAQIADHEEKFARLVTDELAQLVRDRKFRDLILVASPKMLGVLRPLVEPVRRSGIAVVELAQDLSGMTMPQIHDHLADLGLIASRPRAQMLGMRAR